ncbi:MAG: alpha/beta hydrolase [Parasphingorhabdus sp.]
MSQTNIETFDRRSIPSSTRESSWIAADGWELRRLDWPFLGDNSRGSVLFMTGRADFYEKYLETFRDYQAAGWSVTTVDWRGQGGSGRCGPHQYVGHIDDFSTWIADLGNLFDQWRKESEGPHIVVGHSMGGHLVMRALAESVIDPDATILSAPMLAPAGGGMPPWAAQLAAKFMCWTGRARRRAWKGNDNPLEPDLLRQRLLTHDANRYSDEFFWFAERPHLRLGPASWRWVERAYSSARKLSNPFHLRKVKSPVLFLVTAVDELVDNARIEMVHQLLPRSEIKMFGEECAHEIYREVDDVRKVALGTSFEFLDRVAPCDD